MGLLLQQDDGRRKAARMATHGKRRRSALSGALLWF